MNIKWIVVLLCLILFIVVSEAKKYEGKGKDVQKSKYDKSQKGKSNDVISKDEKVEKKTKVKKSAKNSKSAQSAQKVKAVADQKTDSKRQKREATDSKISTNEKSAKSAKTLKSKVQKNVQSKKSLKNGKSENHAKNEKVPSDSTKSNLDGANKEFAVPVEGVQEKIVEPMEFKKVDKKQKREVKPSDAIAPEINAELEDQSFQPAAEKDVQLEKNQPKSQAKKEKKKKQIEKTDAQEAPEIDIISVVENVGLGPE